jgi:branched-chain amino acid transport system permease protein
LAVRRKWNSKSTIPSRFARSSVLVLSLATAISIPWIVPSPYYLHLFIIAGMNAVLAMTFILLLRAGLISLANATFWGVGAYASTVLGTKCHLSFWLALPSSFVITGIVALCIGFFLVRSSGFDFLILTAILGMVAVLVFANIPGLGGFQGIEGIPPPDPVRLPFLGSVEFSKVAFYYLMLFLLMVAVLIFSAFYTSWAGRAWMAIGLKPQLALSLGVNLFRYKLLAFTVSSSIAGMAGCFYAHYIGAIVPNTFDLFKTIHIHIYAILGGLGFPFWGPIVGSLLMTFVPEFLRVTEEVEPIFTGLLMILLILFLPRGLLSLFAFDSRDRTSLSEEILKIIRKKGLPFSFSQKKNAGKPHAPGQ